MMIEEANLHRCRYGSYRSIAAMISFSSVILLLFVLAQLVCMAEATGAGDSDAQPGSVQQFEVGVHESCPVLVFKGPYHYHCSNFDADYGYGDSPPSRLTVLGSTKSTSKTYLFRSIHTKEVPVSGFVWSQYFFLLFLLLPFIAIALMWFADYYENQYFYLYWIDTAVKWLGHFGAYLLISLPLWFPALGYYSGSTFVIDNATDKRLEILVNGNVLGTLPPISYWKLRIGGMQVNIEARDGTRVLESVTLQVDNGFWQAMKRTFIGRGDFVYNIGGENGYYLSTASYFQHSY